MTSKKVNNDFDNYNNRYNDNINPYESKWVNSPYNDYMSSHELNLINYYNENPKYFFYNGITVRITQETINQYISGFNDLVNLEKHRSGEYLIIRNKNQDESVLFLFPNPMTKFNGNTLDIIIKLQISFIGKGNHFNAFRGQEIKVIKPAKVRRNGEYWTLVESGELVL